MSSNPQNTGIAVFTGHSVQLPPENDEHKTTPTSVGYIAKDYEFYPNSSTPSASSMNDPLIGDMREDIEFLIEPALRPQLATVVRPRPWFLYVMTLLQVIGVAWSLILNNQMLGSAIQTDPFNFMIGPSAVALIRMGARVVPCIKPGTPYQDANILCPDGIEPDIQTTNPPSCSLSNICGMGGFDSVPNQWWRFIVPIFLHGGVLHLLFNVIFQIKTGFDLERDIGWWRMGLIYMISGIGGMIFSGIFSSVSLSPTVGASGALYGLVASVLLDLIQTWKVLNNPWKEFFILFAQVVFLLLIGTLPYIDNFAHVGGFITGLFASFLFLPSISFGKWDRRTKRFIKFLAIPVMIAWTVLLIKGFYESDIGSTCTWCKYINCIPGMPWCEDKWQSSIQTTS